MYNGIGFAANQVGIDKRIVVIDIRSLKNEKSYPPLVLINPEIINYSKIKKLIH
ncbi:MAG: peptide deformylase [Leptonema sp. (in: bacteria)]